MRQNTKVQALLIHPSAPVVFRFQQHLLCPCSPCCRVQLFHSLHALAASNPIINCVSRLRLNFKLEGNGGIHGALRYGVSLQNSVFCILPCAFFSKGFFLTNRELMNASKLVCHSVN